MVADIVDCHQPELAGRSPKQGSVAEPVSDLGPQLRRDLSSVPLTLMSLDRVAEDPGTIAAFHVVIATGAFSFTEGLVAFEEQVAGLDPLR
jgi:hypothetical protein